MDGVNFFPSLVMWNGLQKLTWSSQLLQALTLGGSTHLTITVCVDTGCVRLGQGDETKLDDSEREAWQLHLCFKGRQEIGIVELERREGF